MSRVVFPWAGLLLILSLLAGDCGAAERPRMRAFRSEWMVRVFSRNHPLGVRGGRWLAAKAQMKRPSHSNSLPISSFGTEAVELFPLSGFQYLAVEKRGEIYELNPGVMIGGKIAISPEKAVRQPLLLGADGKITRGVLGGILPNAALEVELFNLPRITARPGF